MKLALIHYIGLGVFLLLVALVFAWSRSEGLRLNKKAHFAANLIGALFSLLLAARSIIAYKSWGNYTDIIYAATALLEMVLYMARRFPSDFSPSVKETAICLIAAWGVLFVSFEPGVVLSWHLGASVMAIGLVLQLAAKIYLGRSYGVFAANRGVVTGGPYRVIRHPIYLAYFLVAIGFMLSHLSVYNGVIYAVILSLQIWRILNEERLLGKSAEYAEYKSKVNYRLLPGIWLFR